MSNQDDLFSSPPLYCFDTSSLIVLRQSYPKDLFEPIHSKFADTLRSGKVLVLDLVLDELKQKDSTLSTFVKESTPPIRRKKFDDYIHEAQRLIRVYYDGKKQPQKLKADPHVIACALKEKVEVVTEEILSDDTKIPYVCKREGVGCLNFIEFLRKEGIGLSNESERLVPPGKNR